MTFAVSSAFDFKQLHSLSLVRSDDVARLHTPQCQLTNEVSVASRERRWLMDAPPVDSSKTCRADKKISVPLSHTLCRTTSVKTDVKLDNHLSHTPAELSTAG